MVVILLIMQIVFISGCLTKQNILIDHTESKIRNIKRALQSYSTPSLSQLSGNGTLNFNAKEQVEIIVTTYDCESNALNLGGATFILELLEYDISSTLLSTTNHTFIDNNNGTYTVSFIINQEGRIQYSIYVNSSCTACTYYYNNPSLSGNYDYFCNFDVINRQINYGPVVGTLEDSVSGRVEARVQAPVTDTYTFTCEHNDGCRVKIDGVTIIDQWINGSFNSSNSISFTKDQEYSIILEWYEGTGHFFYTLYWQYGSIQRQVVPLIQNWHNYEYALNSVPNIVTVLPQLCGNGVVDNFEQCDDGNLINGDGCSSLCITEYCSDGFVNNNEGCDDGNQVSGDGCSSICIREYCSDGVVNNNNEQCDDGNLINGDGCSSNCINEYCSDGIVNNNNEQCDDSNLNNGDGCSSLCINEYCGDGTINNINEECDDHNTVSGDGCSSSCVTEYCGDGFVNNNNEECDDSNTSKDDGCDQTCVIEDNYICTAGSLTTSSVCTKCSAGYTNNENHTKCIENDLDNQYSDVLYTTISMAVSGTFIGLMNFMFSGGSIAGVFGLINYLQITIIIPMIGAYISNNVTAFIVNLSSSLLNLNILRPNLILAIDTLINIDYPQKNSYLKLIDLPSGSGLINLQVSIMLFMILIFVGIIVCLIHCTIRKCEKPSRFINMIKFLHKTFIFGIYISFIFEQFLLYSLACFYEISHFDRSTNKRKTSGYISIAMACLLATFILIGFIQWLKARNIEQYNRLYYFRYYFAGIKKTNCTRLYATMFLLRRLILVSIITFGHNYEFKFKLSLFCGIQVFYLLAILICRFQIYCDHNINESICELCYLALLIILFFINKEHDWNHVNERMYMYIIAGNSILYMMISAIAFILNLRKACSRKSNKNKVSALNLNKSRKESVINTNLSGLYKSNRIFVSTVRNDGSSSVTNVSNSTHRIKNHGLNSIVTDNELEGRNYNLNENYKFAQEISKNKVKRRDQFISRRLFQLTNQELQKLEPISHKDKSNLRSLW